MNILLIDSGTTNSRVRLCDGNKVIASVTRKAGARDSAITGSNAMLKEKLRECIDEILKVSHINIDQVEAIIASGMITSNMGLVEIPHISAPASVYDISKEIKSIRFNEVVPKEIKFIPGIKTGFTEESVLAEKDIMRGEETEVFGYLSQANEEDEDIIFMHFGSHHKCIHVQKNRIISSCTGITGELIMAISQNTIIKSSLQNLEEVIINLDWVRKGIDASRSSGISRAMFSVRMLDTMEKLDKNMVTSFFLGIMLHQDLELIKSAISPDTKKIVMYGRKLFPSILKVLLQDTYPEMKLDIINEEESDMLSVRGALSIYKYLE
jgi:2-dehydro-3-deoxygalactonokinase